MSYATCDCELFWLLNIPGIECIESTKEPWHKDLLLLLLVMKKEYIGR